MRSIFKLTLSTAFLLLLQST
ncbi:MAG: hypothetical protein JWQ85_1655, partial [Mucilaginibacter sp.]|nr:hypothetical protein [Mucilaginibacter sp.]